MLSQLLENIDDLLPVPRFVRSGEPDSARADIRVGPSFVWGGLVGSVSAVGLVFELPEESDVYLLLWILGKKINVNVSRQNG